MTKREGKSVSVWEIVETVQETSESGQAIRSSICNEIEGDKKVDGGLERFDR